MIFGIYGSDGLLMETTTCRETAMTIMHYQPCKGLLIRRDKYSLPIHLNDWNKGE